MKNFYVLWIAALSVLLLAGCGNKELTPAEYCAENWGTSSEWVCLFEDGSYCEEEAYANGECKVGENVLIDETSVAEYCVDNGGEIKLEEGASLCMFDDGSYCEAESYFKLECKKGDIIYNAVSDEEAVEEEVSAEENAEEVVAEEVAEVVEEPAQEVVEEVVETAE